MKTFLIEFSGETAGLGDVIAMMPYVRKFSEAYEANVAMRLKNDSLGNLFKLSYPEIIFLKKDENIDYDKKMVLKHEPFNLSLQRIFAEQFGFKNADYIRPTIKIKHSERPIKNKYVTFSIQSTFQMKYWNAEGDIKNQLISPNWVELCKYLRKKNITPVCIDYHENFGVPPFRNHVPTNCVRKMGLTIEEAANYIHHSEFFIGLSSGLSWLAHAIGQKVCMISNFTEDWHEFDLSLDDYIRITNKSVCHGCWNKMNIDFKTSDLDWYTCPKHEGTNRQYECHTSIKPQDVIEKISRWIN